MIPAGFYAPITYGASKPPLRSRLADRIHKAADQVWEWGKLDDQRAMTEVDVALVQLCAALDRLAEAIR